MTIRKRRVELGVLSDLPRIDVSSSPASSRTEALGSEVIFGVNTFEKAVREFELRKGSQKAPGRTQPRSWLRGIVDALSPPKPGARAVGRTSARS